MMCADCPDLDNDAERPAAPWTPRLRCCRDEHVDRRLAGDPRPWEGTEEARKISADEAEAGITPQRQAKPGGNRAKRRAATSKGRKR